MEGKNKALMTAYKLIHGREPFNLKDWEIARDIIEVFGNRRFIGYELEQGCIYEIRNLIDYPDEEIKSKIIMDMEDFIGCVAVPMQ
jgi:hypothetical protein